MIKWSVSRRLSYGFLLLVFDIGLWDLDQNEVAQYGLALQQLAWHLLAKYVRS